MIKPKVRSRILELEAKLDVQLFGVYRGDDGKFYREDGSEAGAGDFKTAAGAVKAVGAVGAGVGAVAGARAVGKRYGADQITSPKKAAVAVARGVGRDVADVARAGAKKSLTPMANAMGGAADRVNRAAAVSGDSARKGRGLRRTLGLMGKSLVRGFDVKARLVELSDKADAAIQLGK